MAVTHRVLSAVYPLYVYDILQEFFVNEFVEYYDDDTISNVKNQISLYKDVCETTVANNKALDISNLPARAHDDCKGVFEFVNKTAAHERLKEKRVKPLQKYVSRRMAIRYMWDTIRAVGNADPLPRDDLYHIVTICTPHAEAIYKCCRERDVKELGKRFDLYAYFGLTQEDISNKQWNWLTALFASLYGRPEYHDTSSMCDQAAAVVVRHFVNS